MTVEARGFVLRRNWMPVAACGALVLGGLALTRAGGEAVPIGYISTWFGVVFGPLLWARNAFPRAEKTRIVATDKTIVLEGHAEMKAADVIEAKVVPRQGQTAVVELALRDGRSFVLRLDADDANALVALLGARRSRFRLVVPYATRFVVVLSLLCAATSLVVGADREALMMTLPSVAFYSTIVAWLVGYVRGRLVVGADGFSTRWLSRERFVAFRDVVWVRPRGRAANRAIQDTLIRLASGRTLRLCTVEAPNMEEERGAESLAMLKHLESAFDRSRRVTDPHEDVPSLVERGSRSDAEWLSGIDALVRGRGAQYRIAAIAPEVLADLAGDPLASAPARVGAAAALIRIGDEELRSRVRIAAEACAETGLRSTLLALSEARDDAGAIAALARCQGDP